MAKQNFNLNYPLFSKIKVNGVETHEVYRYLRCKSQELFDPKKNMAKKIPWFFIYFFIVNNLYCIHHLLILNIIKIR